MIAAGLLGHALAWGLGDVEETSRAALTPGGPTIVVDWPVPDDVM